LLLNRTTLDGLCVLLAETQVHETYVLHVYVETLGLLEEQLFYLLGDVLTEFKQLFGIVWHVINFYIERRLFLTLIARLN